MRYLVLSGALVSLAVLPAATCNNPAPDLAEPRAAGPRTALTHNEFSHNGLSPDALLGNADLRSALAQSQLQNLAETVREHPVVPIAGAPEPPAYYEALTQELLWYVVSCALNDGQSITAPNAGAYPDAGPAAAPASTWNGELGLCSDWYDHAPSGLCQQIVSSCVLARVNALGRRVIVSIRGEDQSLFPLQAKVPIETQLRNTTTLPSTSPMPCDASTPPAMGDATRNCGWKPLYVGRCTAGEPVTVCIGSDAGADCGCSDSTSAAAYPMVRVCKGLYGCDDPNGSPPAATDPMAPYAYFGPIDEGPACVASNVTTIPVSPSPFQFMCPSNGPDGQVGYFSVMIADPDPTASLPPGDVTITSTEPAEYPAPEADVFPYPEGAFYGNIFAPTPTPPVGPEACGPPICTSTHEEVGQSLYGDLYACYDSDWSCGVAHMTDRFCAAAGSTMAQQTCPDGTAYTPCFGNPPQPCAGAPDACEMPDGPDGLTYDLCHGTSVEERNAEYVFPITVYLNNPCDLSSVFLPDGSCPLSQPMSGP